ncbi:MULTISPECIES: hypothetical protein [unclassified Halomonas]|uniref:hypothetical protein n=1 Tax=unclassified Halomonas TaxID=2609666 RepID=UPI001BEB9DFF|nr:MULTISPECIES: hypothetical protein [unclassified Halomonas]MBT2786733.1 hypothetical protein [Halomonas sp. ISL-106]MBT2798615.1 hypothetical protein [Halomonas sp. ISL-104]
MEVFLIVLFFSLVMVAALPSWLMWLLAARYLPSRYVMPPNRMALFSTMLSLVTALLLKVELEGGAFAAILFLLVFSVLWTVALIPICALIKYIFLIKKT